MTKRNKKTKYSIASLLLLLAFSFYLACNKDKEETQRDKPAKAPAAQPKSIKQGRQLRHLTVFEGKVIGIKDGDTFEILYEGQPERVRLAEIDCPEKAQAFGQVARQYASQLAFGKTVTVSSDGKRDRYKRIVGTITTEEGININEELVKAGLAWHYKQYSNSEHLAELQQKAKLKKVGLWQDKNPVAPWNWRKHKRKAAARHKNKEAA